MFLFKQKTAYWMLISDWSSAVCSSELDRPRRPADGGQGRLQRAARLRPAGDDHLDEPHPRLARRADRIRQRRDRAGFEQQGRTGQGSQIGRASLREGGLQYVEVLAVAVTLQKK